MLLYAYKNDSDMKADNTKCWQIREATGMSLNGNTKHEEVTLGNSLVSSYEINLHLPCGSPILPLWDLIQERWKDRVPKQYAHEPGVWECAWSPSYLETWARKIPWGQEFEAKPCNTAKLCLQ